MGKDQYLPVQQEDSEGGSGTVNYTPRRDQQSSNRAPSMRYLCYGALLLSIFVNGIQYGFLKRESQSETEPTPLEYALPIEVSQQYKHFWWNTEYSGGNETLRDELWESILPSHGIIAVDRRYAAARNWPESMYLPGEKSKGVYLLEAYHQLHCLRILRKTMRESIAGQPLTYKPGKHIDHCFDYLLQTAMCNADSTPLYTFGDGTAGHGQLHQCKDWDALKKFATQHPACYRDSVEDILLGKHFGYCDDGDDGLIVGSPQKMDEH